MLEDAAPKPLRPTDRQTPPGQNISEPSGYSVWPAQHPKEAHRNDVRHLRPVPGVFESSTGTRLAASRSTKRNSDLCIASTMRWNNMRKAR